MVKVLDLKTGGLWCLTLYKLTLFSNTVYVESRKGRLSQSVIHVALSLQELETEHHHSDSLRHENADGSYLDESVN